MAKVGKPYTLYLRFLKRAKLLLFLAVCDTCGRGWDDHVLSLTKMLVKKRKRRSKTLYFQCKDCSGKTFLRLVKVKFGQYCQPLHPMNLLSREKRTIFSKLPGRTTETLKPRISQKRVQNEHELFIRAWYCASFRMLAIFKSCSVSGLNIAHVNVFQFFPPLLVSVRFIWEKLFPFWRLSEGS